ncbi:UNVERIFIED_CONTAM: hypothetical protein K2H54_049767, partial [Gekko kuhli]
MPIKVDDRRFPEHGHTLRRAPLPYLASFANVIIVYQRRQHIVSVMGWFPVHVINPVAIRHWDFATE